MFSPKELALLQDALDAVEPPVETRNGVLTRQDIRVLRLATKREVSAIAPAPQHPDDDTEIQAPVKPRSSQPDPRTEQIS